MAAKASDIVSVAIHPSIGVCRVGNSADEYFLGPEVTDPPPAPPGFYREKGSGAVKRQGARFRIYGYNAAGTAVKEITAADGEITWTVHLANKKAAWFQFQVAQDIPEAAAAPTMYLRNATIGDRAALAIDPGPRRIEGAGKSGRDYAFDSGRFMGKQVYLGELRTDEAGRLIVLGGHGKSASYTGSMAVTFANNDGWHDDTADGPVTATVRLGGRTLTALPAWLVVAPPNFAPDQKSVRTLWDLLRDGAIAAGTLKAPVRPSFRDDIAPIFQRLSALQWVNAGYAAMFGFGGTAELGGAASLQRLGRPSPDESAMRAAIVMQFRVAARDLGSPVPWPYHYGDAMAVPAPSTPNAFTTLTPTQMRFLNQWAAGDFTADYDPGWTPPAKIEDLPVAAQPDMLDRAALDFCLADAFHPGCEMTWPMRSASIYMAPFRILHAAAGHPEPSYGLVFTSDMLTGPIFAGQYPGGLTRWMAVPWQTDTASCRSAYGTAQQTFGPYLPTFWPARVPNDVLTEADYEIVMDKSKPLHERREAFGRRLKWNRVIDNGTSFGRINNLAADFAQMGIVETRAGPADDPDFPARIGVEDVAPKPASQPMPVTPNAADPHDASEAAKLNRFPHGLAILARL